jgi:ribosomal-protein-alanine N-acetyltransferase
MSGFELMTVRENDIGMMSRIHALSFDDVWSGAMIRRILAMPGTFGIVARSGRQWSIAGFALVRIAADECEILSLAVGPEHRGAGVGALLLDGAIQQAISGGAAKLFLEVAEDNDVARGLYDSRGLVPVGRRPDYYARKDGTSAAAVTMSCSLRTEAVGAPV